MRALALSPNTMGDRHKQAIGHTFETRPFAMDSSQLRQSEEVMSFGVPANSVQISHHTSFDNIVRWET